MQPIRNRIHVVDANADGKLDLILGDASRESVERATLSATEEAAMHAARQRAKTISKELNFLKRVPQAETKDARLKRTALMSDKQLERDLISEEIACYAPRQFLRHGSVWLFTRRK